MTYRFRMPADFLRLGRQLRGGVLIAFSAIASISPAAEMRTWTSASGSHTTDAEFVELKDDGNVVLKTKAGKTIQVPLGKLSEADQAFAGGRGVAKPLAAGEPEAAKSVEEVEAEASKCHTAKEAVLRYKFYLSKKNLTTEQRAAAEAKLAEWKKKADDDQVRLGKQWMAKPEADKIRKQAQEKIEHAVELLRLRN